ncbi:hypothetical protein [Undibacterium parvum]|uniref:EexN family lipoprotein n=1 Tax=Undibacterium parvum TaxID=401471 RepID=A0A3Q9BQJ5_9BURK|nr:hypothetical protein [Undibacterium parvum]AZP12249.1 hypothetical protein EJN92_09705 [Undibacterium parvum]MCX7217608.1 hypothetical protein [Burkholderiales bacterium]
MLKITTTLATSCLILCGLAGCAIPYDIMQEQAIDACKKIDDRNERNNCLAKNKTSYESYEKQRQELLNKK